MNMKKFVLSVLLMTLIAVMGGCGKKNIDLEAIHRNQGNLLEITHVGQGEMTEEEYNASIYTMTVTYAGAAINPNPVNQIGVTMSDEDFITVYEFCVDAYEKGTFNDYEEDACDGSTYSFTYYDENGDAHLFYSGYINDNKELKNIISIVGSYSLD